jgi:molecular chaperone GrpE
VSRREDDEDVTGGVAAEEAGDTPDAAGADDPSQQPQAEERGLEARAADPGVEQELRAEVENLQDQLLRRRAEFENYRRRVERERSQIADEAVGALLTELLPTIDNLERAAVAAGDEQSVREGVGLILRTLQGLMGARGVEVEDPGGQPFDPERHQALAHEPAPGHADGTIVEVFQKGYLLGGRLLRPALVKVAKGDEAPVRTAEDGETLH